MSCEHDCQRPPVFPAPIDNRPALPRISYRIGDYASFREHMLDRLDHAIELAGWTHRGADDPGIALLESAATAAEILAFYQSLYANEAHLRTARWREDVAALLALTGYRLAPGVAGKATFAFGVKQAVTIPAGFPVKAALEHADEPAVFETTAAVFAKPTLNRFSLYNPRLAPGAITAGLDTLELHSADGDVSRSALEAVDLSPGDRIMLVPGTAMFDAGGSYSDASPQAPAEILVVAEVTQEMDRITVRFEGALTTARGATVRAYKIDRSFRHYGHSAPRQVGTLNENTGLMEFDPTTFERWIAGSIYWGSANSVFYSDLTGTTMPLDQEVDDLATGAAVICQGVATFDEAAGNVPFTVVREIRDAQPDTLLWGGMSSATTVLTLDDTLIANLSIHSETADIRRLRFHETVGAELELRAPTRWTQGSFAGDARLDFYGTHAEALTLAERTLMLAGPDRQWQLLKVENAANDFDLTGRDTVNPWFWPLDLDQEPIFARSAFNESDNLVDAHGNLADCTEGEAQKPVTLGSGDARQAFQTFAVPKSPLTYLLEPGATPPHAGQIEIYVDGQRWQAVDNFFASGADDAHYILRENDAGETFVQFGDSRTGRRLPSGRGNVLAIYRKGNGADGYLEADAEAKAKGKLKPLDKVYLPGPAVGGAPPQATEQAREAGPARMQTVGRMVALADYEAETLALPGVLKARANWVAPTGTPRLEVAILNEDGLKESAHAVQESLREFDRCRGSRRYPPHVINGYRQFIALTVTVAIAADRRADDLEPAIIAALGVDGADDDGIDASAGLFALAQRAFGLGIHDSQILAAVHDVAGVAWAKATGLQALDLGSPIATDPTELAMPDPPAKLRSLRCAADCILALHKTHLRLQLVQDDQAPEC